MSFLTRPDYKALIEDNNFDIVSNANERVLRSAEDTAQEMISGLLRNRYDVAAIFPDVIKWNTGLTFSEDALVIHNELIYRSLIDANSGNKPDEENSTSWVQEDTRNPVVIKLMIDLVLYELFTKLPGRNIPEIRKDRHSMAIEYFKKVNKGIVQPDLPLKDEDDTGHPIRWASNERLDSKY